MKTIVNLTCPNCTAQLSLEKDREIMFCQYCGAKLYLNNENTYTHRHIDEAEVRRAENERLIRLRELELEEKEYEKSLIERKKHIKLWLCALIILLILGVVGFTVGNFALSMCLVFAIIVGMYGFIGFMDSNDKRAKAKRKRALGPDAVVVSEKLANYYHKHYEVVDALARQAGFSDIKCIPLKDLNILHRNESGLTSEVIIDGEDDFDEGDVFSRNSKVMIMYHSPTDSLF